MSTPTITPYAVPTNLSFDLEDIAHPKAMGYGARIGETWVRLAVGPERPLRYYTRDSLAERADFKGQPGQNVLDIGYTWARTELDGGEGLDWDPRQLSIDDSVAAQDIRRFWDSKNLNVEAAAAGEPYSLTLSRVMETWDGGGTLVSPVDMAVSNTKLFIADGNNVHEFPSWDSAPVTIPVGEQTQMLAVTARGESMVVCASGTVYFRSTSGAYTQVPGITDARSVWYVKGRFVVFRTGASNTLEELNPDGTSLVFDTMGTNTVWSLVSSGPAIVAAVDDGTIRSYVPEQGNQTDPSSVNLVIRGRTDMPKGEVPYCIGAEGGVLTVLTVDDDPAQPQTARFYRAEVLSEQYDYVVGQLQLQREWRGSLEGPSVTKNMTSVRNAIYFTIAEPDGIAYVWRFDLVTFGLSRHNTVGPVVDQMQSTLLFEARGAVINDTGVGTNTVILASDDTYNATGYMISPNITFGLNTKIGWLDTVLEAVVSSGDTYIDLLSSTDPAGILDPYHPSWGLVQRIADPTQTGSEIEMIGVESRTLALQVRFHTLGNQTPEVTRTAVRGIPTHRDWLVHLPVNVSDLVEVPGRRPVKIPELGHRLHSAMMSMVGRSVQLIVLDPPMVLNGVVDNLEEPVTYMNKRGSVSVYSMLQFRGRRATSTVEATGTGLGVGRLGIITMGIGQTTSVSDPPPVIGPLYGDYANGYQGTV